MALTKQSLRAGVHVMMNGKLATKEELIKLSKDWTDQNGNNPDAIVSDSIKSLSENAPTATVIISDSVISKGETTLTSNEGNASALCIQNIYLHVWIMPAVCTALFLNYSEMLLIIH